MKKVIYILFPILLSSCIKDYWTREELIIKNRSNHTVELKVYSGNKNIYQIAIPIQSDKAIDNSNMGKNEFMFFPFKIADSVIVNYDNTYNITHYRTGMSNGSSRTILLLENWKKNIHDTYKNYEYEYSIENE